MASLLLLSKPFSGTSSSKEGFSCLESLSSSLPNLSLSPSHLIKFSTMPPTPKKLRMTTGTPIHVFVPNIDPRGQVSVPLLETYH
ncbi:hypothetical protein TorRG33x02_277530 [Trema orientale]|uniref:Uncharacterized protein n=1 Tax=Trema orientale TaxID=63057 RepID=A0A2P5CPU6_TREOI|nr:hypothetical protein TorRG33x02_277530 [Trema orientale]